MNLSFANLLWAGFALIVLGLAVKQISYVLVYGSIFDWIRRLAKQGMESGVPGARKLRELFTCTLCVTTQLAIWLIGLPTGYEVFTHEAALPLHPAALIGRLIYAIAAGAIAAFAVGGVATKLMVKTEYPPKRYNDLFEQHEVLKARYGALAATAKGGAPGMAVASFTLTDLTTLLQGAAATCRGYSCRYLRARCIAEACKNELAKMAGPRGWSAADAAELLGKLAPLLSEYRENAEYYLSRDRDVVSERYIAFVEELYHKYLV